MTHVYLRNNNWNPDSLQVPEHPETDADESEDKNTQDLKKGMIYELPCTDCTKVYIRETRRNLRTRLKEHKYAVKRNDDRNGIAVHAQTQSTLGGCKGQSHPREQLHQQLRRGTKPGDLSSGHNPLRNHEKSWTSNHAELIISNIFNISSNHYI